MGPSITLGQYVDRSFTNTIVSNRAARSCCRESSDDKDESSDAACGEPGYEWSARCGNAGTVPLIRCSSYTRSGDAASESLSDTCALSKDAAKLLEISGSET